LGATGAEHARRGTPSALCVRVRALLDGQLPNDLAGVNAERSTDPDELDHIQATLTPLILGHVRLRVLESVRKLDLRHPGRSSGLDEERPQPVVLGAEG
jgi:hypothetical protein